ncbi:hypothetical protein P3W45_001341 [Vairimorpha bombi]
MDKKYRSKNTNLERIDQINIVNKYVSSTFGRSEISYYVPNKFKYPQYRSNEEIFIVILDHNRININGKDIFIDESMFDKKDLFEILGLFHNSISGHIPANSFVSFIFNNIFSRSVLLGMIDVFINYIGCKGILVQPYSLFMVLGMGIQHCLVINQYTGYTEISLIDDYYVHDWFIVGKTKSLIKDCINMDDDYVEEYQKSRMNEDIPYFMCKLCDYRSKEERIIKEHLKISHIYQDENINGMIIKYENEHGDLIKEIPKRIRFLYFNMERLKRINLRIIYNNNLTKCSEDKSINLEDLSDQLKFIYNNVLKVLVDENMDEAAYKGNEVFNMLDLGKECWITDKEWKCGRLRILKEKILFNI